MIISFISSNICVTSGHSGCPSACLALKSAGRDGELALLVADGSTHGMPLHHSCKTDAALDPSALRLPGTHSVRKFLPKFKISSLFQTQLPDHVHVRLQAIADMKPHELTTAGAPTAAAMESSATAAQGKPLQIAK